MLTHVCPPALEEVMIMIVCKTESNSKKKMKKEADCVHVTGTISLMKLNENRNNLWKYNCKSSN